MVSYLPTESMKLCYINLVAYKSKNLQSLKFGALATMQMEHGQRQGFLGMEGEVGEQGLKKSMRTINDPPLYCLLIRLN